MTKQLIFWLKLRGSDFAVEAVDSSVDHYRVVVQGDNASVYALGNTSPLLTGKLGGGYGFTPDLGHHVDSFSGTAWESWFQTSPFWSRFHGLPQQVFQQVAHDTRKVIGVAISNAQTAKAISGSQP